jgi:hypothetical protein
MMPALSFIKFSMLNIGLVEVWVAVHLVTGNNDGCSTFSSDNDEIGGGSCSTTTSLKDSPTGEGSSSAEDGTMD